MFLLGMYLGVGLRVDVQMFSFRVYYQGVSKTMAAIYISIKWVYMGSNCFISPPTFTIFVFFNLVIYRGLWFLIMVFIWISLMTNEFQNHFMWLLATGYPLPVKCQSNILLIFLLDSVCRDSHWFLVDPYIFLIWILPCM